jgi:hypothetical protein
MKHLVLHDIDGDAAEVADQSQAADPFDVPEKVDFLQSHGGNTGSGTDDQD